MNLPIGLLLEAVHGKDAGGLCRQFTKRRFERCHGLLSVQSVLLRGPRGNDYIIEQGLRPNPAFLPPRFVDNKMVGYSPQKSRGIFETR